MDCFGEGEKNLSEHGEFLSDGERWDLSLDSNGTMTSIRRLV